MTGGGLIQVVAVGEQDFYLTFDPEITFFRTVYRRHTNFSLETIEEVFYNSEGFGKQVRCFIPRQGDLISKLTLNVKLGSLNEDFYNKVERNQTIKHNDNKNIKCACSKCLEEEYKDVLTFGWVNSLGHALIRSTWIEIGGQRIDKQYGEWFEIWTELTQNEEKKAGYYEMIGKVPPAAFKPTTFSGEMELYIPLNFWFCRNIGLALPILALCYHQVELVIEFRKFEELYVTNKAFQINEPTIHPKPPKFESQILIEYVYLDIEERKQFYEQSHIYLIEQLQYTNRLPVSASHVPIDLYFNHPIKELFWVLQRNDVEITKDWFNFSTFPNRNTNIIRDTFERAVIQFNGVDRFRSKKASYYRLYQPYYYNTRTPQNYIYTYSFGLRPEEIHPTGQMNFSRVENARIVLSMHSRRSYTDYSFRGYGLGYNILIVTSGMAGLLFTN